MTDIFELEAKIRADVGKGASRRLRREAGLVPAIIYGAGKEPTLITMPHNKVIHALENEAFYSHILTLNVAGKPEKVVIKDIQRHPFKKQIQHMDFLRIKADETIDMNVPLHFIGEDVAPGVKADGGAVTHYMTEVEIRCLPADLPEFIEVDLSNLELNAMIHLTELQLPKGVEIVSILHDPENDLPVATIQVARVIEEPPEEAPETIETEITTAKEEGKEEEKTEAKKE